MEKLAEKETIALAKPATKQVTGKMLDFVESARVPMPLGPSVYLVAAKSSKPSSSVSTSTWSSFKNPSAVVLSAAPSLAPSWLNSLALSWLGSSSESPVSSESSSS